MRRIAVTVGLAFALACGGLVPGEPACVGFCDDGGEQSAPADWPAELPFLAGGTRQDVGPTGPIPTVVYSYGRTIDEVSEVMHRELLAADWAITSDEDFEGMTGRKIRMTVEKGGASVQVSIFGLEGVTYLQIVAL